MEIKLYRMTCEKNRVNKTDFLTLKTTVSGTLKAPTSILNPVVTLELPYEDYLGTNTLPEFNYAFIRELGFRYYFVNDIQVINGLFVVYFAIDVLHTFRNMIGDAWGYVERNEFEYDLKINDDLRPMESGRTTTARDMAKGSLVNVTFNANLSLAYNIAVCAYSVGNDLGSQDVSGVGNLPQIDPDEYRDPYVETYVLDDRNFYFLEKWLRDNSDKRQFVYSSVVFPFELDDFTLPNSYLKINLNGDLINPEIDAPMAYRYAYRSITPYLIIADETFPAISTYLDTSPRTTVEFYLPYYGTQEIDYVSIAGKRVIVFYSLSMYTGEGTVTIYNYTDGVSLFTGNCRVGYRYASTSTNFEELNRQRLSAALNTTLGLIGSAISIAGGVAGANPVMTAGGILGAARTIGGAVEQNMNMIPRVSVNIPTAISGLHESQNVRIRFTKVVPAFDDTAYVVRFAHDFGLPLCQPRLLSNMRGFTTISEVHLKEDDSTTNGITFPMSTEYDMIAEQLRVGVLFPEP